MDTTRDLGKTPLRISPRGGSALLGILATSLMLTIGGQAVAKPAPTPQPRVTEGSLFTVDENGHPQQACPLKHTDVKIDVSGFLARATVTQQFENPFPEKIEAVYTFPLPQHAAVDDMTLTVGDRLVKGKIKRREEAQAIYEAARAQGHVAGLLDQERPNIFTQSVANIMPGEQVTVTISYVQTLTYEDGAYELVFPMVVGPRYIPGMATGKQGGGWAPDTDQVPDASRVTPPVTPEGTRAGHDISLHVTLDAGIPVEAIRSPTHEVVIQNSGTSRAAIHLKNKAAIPNKDFILRYQVAGSNIQDAVLTHRVGENGFFTLILQPPKRVTADKVTPKELVFVLDTSGSMSGFPIEKAKETMRLALDGLYPQDKFNLITFAGDTHILFPEPVAASEENLRLAQDFLATRRGRGGTEMMKAIRAALDPSDSRKHVRIVCFMTDGYVGNDMAIIDEVQRHPNARIFAFGIGSSVNRFLLDKVAEYGRGEVEYVGLKDDGSAAARRFHERVRNPILTDISVDWGDLQVQEVYPTQVLDLFAARPVILSGRYTKPGKGVVELVGIANGHTVTRKIAVTLPVSEERHDVLATLWARKKIAYLMGQDFHGMQRGLPRTEIREAITELGLEYRLMTQFTSFVAVEEMTVTEGGEPRRIEVPVEMPEGVSYEGVFGEQGNRAMKSGRLGSLSARTSRAPTGNALHFFGGAMSGFGGAVMARDEAARPAVSTSTPNKLHAGLARIVDRLDSNPQTTSPEEATFVKDGKATVQIWLADTSAETISTLKKLGLEILLQPKSGKVVIGRISLDRLEKLAELDAVKYVAPFTAGA